MDFNMSVFKLDDDQPPAQADASNLRRRLPDFELQETDLRAHYENVVANVLSSIRRDWRLIASLVALALTLACVIIPLMPRQYSATALVYPTLFQSDQGGKLTPMGTIDATALVASEARLIVSDAILQTAVRRLEMDRKPETDETQSWLAGIKGWIRAMILPETRNYSAFERQVALLRSRVDVQKDTRSYLVSVSITARSPEEAAAIVNTIALEYFRDKKMLRSQNAVTAAESELVRQLAINGEKHPKVLQSLDGLEAARAELHALAAAEEGGQNTQVTDEGVKLAIPNRTPTSPKGFVILAVSFIASLLAGIALAVWRDRLGFEPRRFLVGLVSSGSRLGQMPLLHRLAAVLAPPSQRALGILSLGGGWIGGRWHRFGPRLTRIGTGRRQRQISPPAASPRES
jgi:uncharacterized protein involved in exopolysaccharide biosynthesis